MSGVSIEQMWQENHAAERDDSKLSVIIAGLRFLKTPRVQVNRGTVALKAVVTVTTDLGETFYPTDLELIVTIRDPDEDGDIYLRRRVRWQAGSRALPVSFDLSQQDVDWPACFHVATKNADYDYGSGFMRPVVAIWSGALNPAHGIVDSGTRVERRFKSIAERTVSLLEDAGDSIARHLWDGSQALAHYIDHTVSLQTTSTDLPLLEMVLVAATYRKLNVLELGCGCGTVSISVAQTIPGCDVVLTDLPDVAELVKANIERMRPAMSSKVCFEPLDWEKPLPETLQNRTNDLIIVSECTYNSDTLSALATTLLALTTRSPKAIIVLATKTRHASEAAFFDIAREVGLILDGTTRVQLPGIPGNGYADTATDVGLFVLHGKNHRLSISPTTSDREVPRQSRRDLRRTSTG